MLVYRRLCQQELKYILNGELQHLGVYFKKGKLGNNHKYKQNERYIHLFKTKEDIRFIRSYQNEVTDAYYICTFDIPEVILKTFQGKGEYDLGGYDGFTTNVVEYAIEVSKFNCSWLVSYEKDDGSSASIDLGR